MSKKKKALIFSQCCRQSGATSDSESALDSKQEVEEHHQSLCFDAEAHVGVLPFVVADLQKRGFYVKEYRESYTRLPRRSGW